MEKNQEKRRQEQPVEKTMFPEEGRREENLGRKLGLFLALVFGVAWLGIITAWVAGESYGSSFFNALVTWITLLPALVTVVARKAMGEKLNIDEMGIAPHFRGNWLRYPAAYLFPAAFVVVAAALYFLAFPGQFDPGAQTFLTILTDSGVDPQVARDYLNSVVLQGLFGGAVVNIVPAFCEMLGFQGYLLPRLYGCFRSRRGLKAALLCGAVWGAWYLPLFGDGYLYGSDYPGCPVVGMLLGLAFHTLMGFLLSYLTLRSGSILPAMLARGGLSAGGAVALSFTTGEASQLLGPDVYGLFGILVLLVLAVPCALSMVRREKAGALLYRRPQPKKKA